jgi:hypothetical protein
MKTVMRIATRFASAAWVLCALLPPAGLRAATVAELWQQARQSTFEVVLPKIEPSHVTYEKPLPLELLPFQERNDKYWSIGTAFAIAPDVFVSNAHVLVSGMASPLGPPHLRDASGKTFPVDRVFRFSLHEDYIVFSARGARAEGALLTRGEAAVGVKVYAVGNAQGEGVVLRDGLLTSMTPEEQDGRWKWLRFSAAASPGNSGGPLLNEDGQVIGVVTARSPGENLNYALPIAQVLQGSDDRAVFDVRNSFGLPILRQQMVAEFKGGFNLPLAWDEFSRRLLDASNGQYETSKSALLARHAAELPPAGRSADLLAQLERDKALALIKQQPDDSWGYTELANAEDTALDGGGTLRIGSFEGAFAFRLARKETVRDPRMHRDGKAFMDTLLKGIKLPRMIGTQAIRITSLGEPRMQSLHTDRFERIWQLRDWSLGYADMHLIALALPTPNGYVGLLQFASAAEHASTTSGMKLLADYLHLAYEGNTSQWQAFVADKELCPPALRAVRFATDTGAALRLTGLDVRIPPTVLPLKPESTLAVYSGYWQQGQQLAAKPAGVTVTLVPDDDESSWLGVWAQSVPAAAASEALRKRWRQMSDRESPFDGRPRYNPEFTQFWTETTIGNAASGVLFEVTLSLRERGVQPRHLGERRDQLLAGLGLRENE